MGGSAKITTAPHKFVKKLLAFFIPPIEIIYNLEDTVVQKEVRQGAISLAQTW